jgi:ABC-type multidrug transport system ATPase subunit
VILSTHIVEDVSDLCPRMAVINEGKVLLTGETQELTRSLQGRVWRHCIEPRELGAYQSRMQVLAHRLRAGQLVIHVLADSRPEPDFIPVEGSLEDLYFATLAHSRGAKAPAAAAA